MNDRRQTRSCLCRPGLASLAALLGLAAGCGGPAAPPPPPADWQPTLESWRSEREAGPEAAQRLVVPGRVRWLQPGETPFGSDSSLPIALPAGSAPGRAGALVLEGDTVTLRVAPDTVVTVNGSPATDGMALAPDATGKPDVVTVGRVSFTVIRRGDKLGVRAKDPRGPRPRAVPCALLVPARSGVADPRAVRAGGLAEADHGAERGRRRAADVGARGGALHDRRPGARVDPARAARTTRSCSSSSRTGRPGRRRTGRAASSTPRRPGPTAASCSTSTGPTTRPAPSRRSRPARCRRRRTRSTSRPRRREEIAGGTEGPPRS